MYKIIGADQKEYGPVTAEQILQWVQEGRLNAASRVRAEGAGEWKLLRELPEFAALLPPPPAPITYHGARAFAPTNPIAGWALGTGVFSVLCCCNIAAPVSIVLGLVALSEIKHNPNQGGRGYAIAGIALGCFSLLMVLVWILTALLSPGFLSNLPNRFAL